MENKKIAIDIILKELFKKVPQDKQGIVKMGIDAINNKIIGDDDVSTSKYIIDTIYDLNFWDIAHFLELQICNYTEIELSNEYYFHIFGKLKTL